MSAKLMQALPLSFSEIVIVGLGRETSLLIS